MEAKAVSSATTCSWCRARVFPAPLAMTETRRPDGSDLDNRHRFGARARDAGDSPTAVCTADIRALARSLRSGLQARVYQAWICYRKASARVSSEIAPRSPGMVVVGAVVAPTSESFPGYLYQRRRSGMALLYPSEPPRNDQRSAQTSAVGHSTCSGHRRAIAQSRRFPTFQPSPRIKGGSTHSGHCRDRD